MTTLTTLSLIINKNSFNNNKSFFVTEILVTYWEKIFVTYLSEKEYSSRVHFKTWTSVRKMQSTQWENGQFLSCKSQRGKNNAQWTYGKSVHPPQYSGKHKIKQHWCATLNTPNI